MNKQELPEQIREVVKDGLANHTGAFINPWIVRDRYTHDQLARLLADILSSNRLSSNLENFVKKKVNEVLDEMEDENAKIKTVREARFMKGYYKHQEEILSAIEQVRKRFSNE